MGLLGNEPKGDGLAQDSVECGGFTYTVESAESLQRSCAELVYCKRMHIDPQECQSHPAQSPITMRDFPKMKPGGDAMRLNYFSPSQTDANARNC